jgi:hypothetical protein
MQKILYILFLIDLLLSVRIVEFHLGMDIELRQRRFLRL